MSKSVFCTLSIRSPAFHPVQAWTLGWRGGLGRDRARRDAARLVDPLRAEEAGEGPEAAALGDAAALRRDHDLGKHGERVSKTLFDTI